LRLFVVALILQFQGPTDPWEELDASSSITFKRELVANPQVQQLHKRSGEITLPLSYSGGIIYKATIQFGTPPQQINVQVDTGSAPSTGTTPPTGSITEDGSCGGAEGSSCPSGECCSRYGRTYSIYQDLKIRNTLANSLFFSFRF
jgi:hypothetical protein